MQVRAFVQNQFSNYRLRGKIVQNNSSKYDLDRGFLPQRVFPVFTQMSRIALAQSV